VGCSPVLFQFLGFPWFFWVRCLGSFVGCLLGVISVSRFCLGVFLLGFCSGFFRSALALLCILLVYVGTLYAFFSIKFYLLIKKKEHHETISQPNCWA
jgi:uncharacterized membrane protein